MADGGPHAPQGSVSELGEFELIAAVIARMPATVDVLLGPGDDAAVVAAADGQVVATTDALVEGVHFKRAWSSGVDVGHKAAAANLADVAAMGARPTALLVALALPADLPAPWALGLADGLAGEAAAAGAGVAGGDVVRADVLVVAVTALGSLDGRPPVRRGGARPGDVLAVCGVLGFSAGGLAVLSRGFTAPRALVAAHRRPTPPYAAGPQAAAAGATAMIDVSDGLLADLAHVATASGVAVDVDTATLEVDEVLASAASALGLDAREWQLTGGEDHALVATFPPGTALPPGWRRLGSVAEGSGVSVDGVSYAGPGGYRHFGGPTR